MKLEDLEAARALRDKFVRMVITAIGEGEVDNGAMLAPVGSLCEIVDRAEVLYAGEKRQEALAQQLIAIRDRGSLTLAEMHAIEERVVGEQARGWVRTMPPGLCELSASADRWVGGERLKSMSDDEIRAAVEGGAS